MNALFVVILMIVPITYMYELLGVLGMVIVVSVGYCICNVINNDNI